MQLLAYRDPTGRVFILDEIQALPPLAHGYEWTMVIQPDARARTANDAIGPIASRNPGATYASIEPSYGEPSYGEPSYGEPAGPVASAEPGDAIGDTDAIGTTDAIATAIATATAPGERVGPPAPSSPPNRGILDTLIPLLAPRTGQSPQERAEELIDAIPADVKDKLVQLFRAFQGPILPAFPGA